MRSYVAAFSLSLLAFSTTSFPLLAAQNPVSTMIESSQQHNGFMNLFYDDKSGDVFMEIKALNKPFLMVTSLPHGVGSNDIGLDRGQLGQTRMVQFERYGPYLILKQLNTDYRANTHNKAEQRAVKEAFAESILWRGKIESESKPLVKLNDLVLKDFHGIEKRLLATKQGNYKLNSSNSLVLPKGIKSFEKNADIDVLLTYNTNKAGKYAQSVTPDANSISIRKRFSFVELPDENYNIRQYNPNSGFFAQTFMDYAQPVNHNIVQRYIVRHRLQKKVPGAAPSEVVKPITYYLDPGVPEPIRSALLDGARWWEQAFTDAGFINGFQVKLLPETADPQDIRYNMIQWVHRATRGWSYGAVISDPRTGEIIKGHVTLGSLRVRQDYLIAKGLTAGWKDREAAEKASMDLALARIRQLSAHEVGHTLGIEHNFAASSHNNDSVMDYPHPYISLKNSEIDISEPYGTSLGAWDKWAVSYGYGEYDKGQSPKVIQQQQIESAQSQGIRYIGEADSRSANAAHVYASLWDNGDNAIDELERMQKVRRVAIDNFNQNALTEGAVQSELIDAFVPIYLMSRFQIQAAAKWIGGVDYRTEDDSAWAFVKPKAQKNALDALLNMLKPSELTVPQTLLETFIPKSGDYRPTRESFASSLGNLADETGMAEVLSRHVVKNLLQPARLNRVNQASTKQSKSLSVDDILEQLTKSTLLKKRNTTHTQAIWMRTNAVVIDELLASIHNPKSSFEVKGVIAKKLSYLEDKLESRAKRANESQEAHYLWLKEGIEKGQKDKAFRLIEKPLPMPPGSPI
ncbi:zinc-dependent metalloprotease [Shewanella sp. 202IG2-18]|uniref:zinc-dependent metalloprotease n=1 Tax=Parashewanella hymeniacidonis TaxID=2807618 RepID=UPI0019609B73|nr:zinc-dependent metalloprotease [Parashewanella hymeniacidonis]MBM7072467.1 zinc-dependent metalloprotease [Parashewanella hymeniacidonis]